MAKKIIIGLCIAVLLIAILFVGGKTLLEVVPNVSGITDETLLKSDLNTAELLGKTTRIWINEKSEHESLISRKYQKYDEIGDLQEYIIKCNPKCLKNSAYYVNLENGIIKVVIATSEEEANKVDAKEVDYDGTKSGLAYINNEVSKNVETEVNKDSNKEIEKEINDEDVFAIAEDIIKNKNDLIVETKEYDENFVKSFSNLEVINDSWRAGEKEGVESYYYSGKVNLDVDDELEEVSLNSLTREFNFNDETIQLNGKYNSVGLVDINPNDSNYELLLGTDGPSDDPAFIVITYINDNMNATYIEGYPIYTNNKGAFYMEDRSVFNSFSPLFIDGYYEILEDGTIKYNKFDFSKIDKENYVFTIGNEYIKFIEDVNNIKDFYEISYEEYINSRVDIPSQTKFKVLDFSELSRSYVYAQLEDGRIGWLVNQWNFVD